MKKSICIFLAFTLALYSVVAFITFEPNPTTWEATGRGVFIFFDLFLSFIYIAIESDNK